MSPPLPDQSKQRDLEYNINGNRSFNNWTRVHNDTCSYSNSLRVGSKPIKYYVNDYNSPQSDPFQTFSMIGNMKQFNVRNDFERAMPSRLNPIYQSYVTPYATTPNLANQAENRTHTNTGTELRFGSDLRSFKSSIGLGEVDYNRWEPGVNAFTSQNAGQFGSNGRIQSNISRDGKFDPLTQNNVMIANGAYNRSGISSRNEMHNYIELNKC